MTDMTPHQPDVLGLEWPPLYESELPLAQGVERGHSFLSTEAATIQAADCTFVRDVLGGHRFHLLHHVYPKGNEVAQDVRQTLVPCNSGSIGGGATLVGGAASVADALALSADTKAIKFPSGIVSTATTWYGTTGLFTSRRILRISIDYVLLYEIANPENDPARPLIQLDHTTAFWNSLYGSIEGSVLQPGAGVAGLETRRFSLGEMNGLSNGDPVLSNDRFPWTVIDINAFNNAGYALKFTFPGSTPTVDLTFCRMVVDHCIENRVAVGGKVFGFSGGAPYASAVAGAQRVLVRTPSGSVNWAKANGVEYTHAVTLADAGGPLPHPGTGRMTSFGDVPITTGLESTEVYAPHEGRQMPRGSKNEIILAEAVPTITGLHLLSSLGTTPDGNPYNHRKFARVDAAFSAIQGIAQRASGADTSYEFCRFYARKIGSPGSPLQVTVLGQTASITEDQFDALPFLTSDGIKEVVIRFGAPPVLNNSGTPVNMLFSVPGGPGDGANRWDILGAEHELFSNADFATYETGTANAVIENVTYTDADLAAILATDPPQVTGLNAAVQAYDVAVAQFYCGQQELGSECLPRAVSYISMSWNSPGIANFSHYELQRADSVDESSEFETIARITAQGGTDFRDFEARWGVTSLYRIRVCRTDEFCGPWSTTAIIVQGALPASSYVGPGTLVFTSNGAWPDSVVYVEGHEGDRAQEFEFPEAETTLIERFFQRDAQPGFRPSERGGVRFTRTVMVSTRGDLSDGGDVFRKDRAFLALRNLCWADVPYICVRDEVGNRWFATVLVGGGSTRSSARADGLFPTPSTGGGVALAQVEIVESTFTPYPFDRNTNLT